MLIQEGFSDCAPIALINYMKYLGLRWGKKDLPLVRYTLVTEATGTDFLQLGAAVDMLYPKVHVNFHRDTKSIVNYMKSKRPVIIAYNYKKDNEVFAHLCFCYYDKGVIVTNFVKGSPYTKMNEIQFNNFLQNSLDEPGILYLRGK